MEPAVAVLRPGRAGFVLATCLAVLVAVKWFVAQLSPEGHDGRATAAFVASVQPGPIDDILYVDDHAMWELRFYLGVQVRETWARRTPYEPAFQPHRRLAELIAAGRAPAGRLYVVNPRSIAQFADTLRAAGYCVRELGRKSDSVVYRAHPAASPECMSPAGPEPGRQG